MSNPKYPNRVEFQITPKDKPRYKYEIPDEIADLAEQKRRIERIQEERELRDSTREVWE